MHCSAESTTSRIRGGRAESSAANSRRKRARRSSGETPCHSPGFTRAAAEGFAAIASRAWFETPGLRG